MTKVFYHLRTKQQLADVPQAHIIRRRATTFYRTVFELDAKFRWCLTGTPIQNTLEDIGSLFTFTKIRPFDSLAVFRKFIVTPFNESSQRRAVASNRLRILLDSLCLRRTKEVLNLPGQEEIPRFINFSREERQQYDTTKDSMNRAIRQQCGESFRRHDFGLFQTILQLRIVCNHGTFQDPFNWAKQRNRDFEREVVADMLSGSGRVTCSSCGQPMEVHGNGSLYRTYDECVHVCCFECLTSSPHGDLDTSELAEACPLCKDSGIISKMSKGRRSENNTSFREDYFRAGGFSSKMTAMVHDVSKDVRTTKR